MKNFLKSTKFKISLLCIILVVVGIGIGMLINSSKTIPTLADGTEVIATIDGKNFSINDLYDELKKQGGNDVLINLIDEYISNKEIDDTTEAEDYATSYVKSIKSQYEAYGEDFKAALKSAGYESEDELKQNVMTDYLKTLVADKFIKEVENGFITEKEIKDYYDSKITGAMTVRYILLKPEEVDSTDSEYATKTKENEAEALSRANEVISKLKNGEKFADLAKEYSDDTSTASEGGLLSGFTSNDVVEEFWNASINLEDGKYTNSPVKSSYGYFVILRVKQDEKPSMADSTDEILDALLESKKEEDSDISAKAWIKIRKNYNLEIIDSEIKKVYNEKVKEYK